VYSPDLRQSVRQHVAASIASDDDSRKMGVYLQQECDRVLSLWLGASSEHADHIGRALTTAWLTSAALSYFYLVEDIIEATPNALSVPVGGVLFELEQAMDRTGDWSWGTERAQELFAKVIDYKQPPKQHSPEN
jgi:hypothetical protein